MRVAVGVIIGAILLIALASPLLIRYYSGSEWTFFTNTVAAPVCGAWNTTVGPRLFNGGFNSIDGSGDDAVWAVGEQSDMFSHDVGAALFAHWDGTKWAQWSLANSTDGNNIRLVSVSTVTASDAWAVGYSPDAYDTTHLVLMRWDGVTWNHVRVMHSGFSESKLHAVKAISQDDVWFVGSYSSVGPTDQPLILHWDGTQMITVPVPQLFAQGATLWGVSGTASNDVWAVGEQEATLAGRLINQTLTMHWDGTQWLVVQSPNLGPYSNYLYGVEAVTAEQGWAVGFAAKPKSPPGNIESEFILMHWDGRNWSFVNSFTGLNSSSTYSLTSVSSSSPADIWVVGSEETLGRYKSVILHWDGKTWAVVPSPNPPNIPSLRAVRVFSSGAVWVASDIQGEDAPDYGFFSRFVKVACPTSDEHE